MFPNLRIMRIATIGALVAALGLAGCGRKSGLDPPPGAALTGPAASAPSPADGQRAFGSRID
jgi:predicted small lipoprotein YifL